MPNRIPIPVGILLVIVLVGVMGAVTSVFQNSTATRASSSTVPKQPMITNIKPTAMTVVWQTDTPTTGQLMLTNAAGVKLVSFDDRDKTGVLGQYLIHSATVTGLTAQTDYDITILSAGKRYPLSSPISPVRTPLVIFETPEPHDPAYGSVVDTGGLPVTDAVVFLTIDGSQPVSTTTTKNGSWVIPLTTLRTNDLAAPMSFQTAKTASFTVISPGTQTTATAFVTSLSPVPVIVTGGTNDFTREQSKKAETIANTPTLQPTVMPTVTPATSQAPNPTQKDAAVLGASTTKIVQNRKIIFTAPPRGAHLTSVRPNIAGTGIPGKALTLTIGRTNPEIISLTFDLQGKFTYTPKNALPAGQTSVTMTTKDEKDKRVAVTQLFSIFKSGTQVLGDATASATIEPTPEPTLEPTLEEVPTEESTQTGEPMPETGSTLPLILLLIGAMSMISIGMVTLKQ